MSVIVKGMKMPKDCRECRLQDYSFTTGVTWCGANWAVLARNFEPINFFDGRPEWCPLVDLGKHGDLIDRGKLLRDIEKYHVSDGKFQHWTEIQNAVIEAEGTDEGSN